MSDFLAGRVARYAEEHGLLPPGAPVLAMVSGGPDSTCLMHVLGAIHDGRLGVLAIDHALRPESGAEAAAVVAAARDAGLQGWVRRLDLPPGPALQERARDGRYDAAREVAREHGFQLIATGHTASDQAETVLFRIARGTGRTGALGIAPRRDDLVRPLLCVTRAETRAWCTVRGLDIVSDPSNADPRFARTRVREGLLAALEAVHPGAEAAVVRFAQQLRDEAAIVEGALSAAWERCAAGAGLRVSALSAEPPAIRRLLARRVLAGAGVAADATVVARALQLARSGGGPLDVPGGLIAVDDGVLVAEPPIPPAPDEAPLPVPGAVRFADALVGAHRGSGAPPSASRVAVRVDSPLTVRPPRPGDRISLAGGGHQAVGRLLAAAGVPARRRHLVPVVAAGERVVWVARYRADPELLAPTATHATVLEVT